MIEKTKKYAFDCHQSINQLYDGKPYSFHLEMVVEIANNFIFYIPEKDRDIVISGCYIHDCIEDTGVDWNDVMIHTNVKIANLSNVLATKSKGTRKERFSDEYYKGIRKEKYAIFVKLCDRIANVKQGLVNGKPILDMYKKEHKHFKEMLYDNYEYQKMWDYLDFLISK